MYLITRSIQYTMQIELLAFIFFEPLVTLAEKRDKLFDKSVRGG